jgi:hypothetical protein
MVAHKHDSTLETESSLEGMYRTILACQSVLPSILDEIESVIR